MLFINKNNNDVQFALNEHFSNIRCLVWRKIGALNELNEIKTCGFVDCKICSGRIEKIQNVPPLLYDFLNDDILLELLIKGEPDTLIQLEKEFWQKVFPGLNHLDWTKVYKKKKEDLTLDGYEFQKLITPYIKSIEKIIPYDSWFVQNDPASYYSAYHLATYLNIRSCVYCNRTYTITQFKTNNNGKTEKLIRPQFDHWFPQEKFPILALSFFNLVPSCSICNSSVKGRKVFSLEHYLHPYIDDVVSNISFGYEHVKNTDLVKIELVALHSDKNMEARIDNTIKDFHIEEMYNAHHSELIDLIKLKQYYSENYLTSLIKSFPEANLSSDEIYRIVFGVELNQEDFHKRPMSKFKHDILKELKII